MVIGLSNNEKYQQSLRALLILPLTQLVNDSFSCRVSLPLSELFLYFHFTFLSILILFLFSNLYLFIYLLIYLFIHIFIDV